MATEDLIPLEPLHDKFTAFGAAVKRIDGHSFEALHEAFSAYPFQTGKLNVVIADTVRGKGLPSIERRADRWFCNFNATEVAELLKELHGEHLTNLTSETLVVR
jgi:transketolase